MSKEKELLRKQLELLAEQSVDELPEELRDLSAAMCKVYDRLLRKFCVSEFRQNQEYYTIHVHDGGLYPLSTSFPGGWDGMRTGTA